MEAETADSHRLVTVAASGEFCMLSDIHRLWCSKSFDVSLEESCTVVQDT